VLAPERVEQGRHSAKVLSILPRAADLYRRQIAQGLDGNAREALKARVFQRHWFSGKYAWSRCRMAGSSPIGIRTKPRFYAARIMW